MAFIRPTFQEIVDRIEKDMESRLTGNISLLRRAFLRVMSKVFAGAIYSVYGFVAFIADMVFVTTAEDSWLDKHASMWLSSGRIPGGFSTGITRFTGTNGTTIPENTRIQDSNGIEFATTGDVAISAGIADANIIAVEDGTSGNLAGGTSLQLISPVIGIDSETILQGATTGGQGKETDDELRRRILLRIQTPPAGGSVSDYKSWALEVAGVKNAWVFPLYNGDGTVGTLITAEGDDPLPSTQLKQDVQDYTDERRPVTANFLVIGLEPSQKKLIDFSIDLPANENTVENQSVISKNLKDFFDTNVNPGEDILISGIQNAIFSSGISNYDITAITIDGSTVSVDDIELSNSTAFGLYAYGVLNDIIYGDI